MGPRSTCNPAWHGMTVTFMGMRTGGRDTHAREHVRRRLHPGRPLHLFSFHSRPRHDHIKAGLMQSRVADRSDSDTPAGSPTDTGFARNPSSRTCRSGRGRLLTSSAPDGHMLPRGELHPCLLYRRPPSLRFFPPRPPPLPIFPYCPYPTGPVVMLWPGVREAKRTRSNPCARCPARPRVTSAIIISSTSPSSWPPGGSAWLGAALASSLPRGRSDFASPTLTYRTPPPDQPGGLPCTRGVSPHRFHNIVPAVDPGADVLEPRPGSRASRPSTSRPLASAVFGRCCSTPMSPTGSSRRRRGTFLRSSMGAGRSYPALARINLPDHHRYGSSSSTSASAGDQQHLESAGTSGGLIGGVSSVSPRRGRRRRRLPLVYRWRCLALAAVAVLAAISVA